MGLTAAGLAGISDAVPPLDLKPLQGSLQALDDALALFDAHASSIPGAGAVDPRLRPTLRAAVVKNFEIAYEVAGKAMRRALLISQGEGLVSQQRSRRDLYRDACRAGLVNEASLQHWFGFHEARNEAVHLYREQEADAALAAARHFAAAAAQLLGRLQHAAD